MSARTKEQFVNFVEEIAPNIKNNRRYKQLLNLILDKFEGVYPRGSSNGMRAKFLGAMIQTQGKNISDEINISRNSTVTSIEYANNLTELIVSDFGGFVEEQKFLFDKQYTLIYGSNGSGKTSFCDALEYSLLDYITDAESKRFDIEKYIINSRTGRTNKPVLNGLCAKGNNICIEPSVEYYKFCFIEKNRIEGFARVSAHTPSEQGELLSELFGLDDFNKFVSDFTLNFNDRYIDLTGKFITRLSIKKTEIDGDKKTVETVNKSILSDDKNKKIAEEIFEKLSGYQSAYKNINSHIVGGLVSEEVDGVEKEIEIRGVINELLASLMPEDKQKKKIVNISDCLEKANHIKESINNYKERKSSFDKIKDRIDYLDLFKSVLSIEELSPEQCPVCETLIFGDGSTTKVNPYISARKSVDDLQDAANIQVKKNESYQYVKYICNNYFEKIRDVNELFSNVGIESSILFDDLNDAIIKDVEHDAIQYASVFSDSIISKKELYIKANEIIEKENMVIDDTANKNKDINDKVNSYRELLTDIVKIDERNSTYQNQIKDAQLRIDKFNSDNAELIKSAESEKEKISRNNEYVKAYNEFVDDLNNYSYRLPMLLVKELSSKTLDFYNKINKHDDNLDLLEELILPLSPGDEIMLVFNDGTKKKHNALHVLSEGHVKCLGLSILLSKIIYDDLPFIIFDDVVNAIDDEHRAGIRELFFSDPDVSSRQIILTSHGEEFVKDIENQFDKEEHKKKITRIDLLKSKGGEGIKNSQIFSTDHYLREAEMFFDGSRNRKCLSMCRKALENTINSLWKKLGKTYNIILSLSLRSPKGNPDLMGVVLALSKYITKHVNDDKYLKINEVLVYLAGLEAKHNVVWSYLNKGTHEEEDKIEFDNAIVKDVLSAMTKLELLVKSN